MATPASHVTVACRFPLTHSAHKRALDPQLLKADGLESFKRLYFIKQEHLSGIGIEQLLHTLRDEGVASGEDPLLRTAHKCIQSSYAYDFVNQYSHEHSFERLFMGLMQIQRDQRDLKKLHSRLLAMVRLAYSSKWHGAWRFDCLHCSVGAIITHLDAAAEDLRTAFHTAIRPFARNIHIAELPVEVLHMIFHHVGGGIDYTSVRAFEKLQDDMNQVRDTQSIKNVRLTCRLFSNASARLLVPLLHISITQESLEHLNRVSHHPIISKGVHVVCVNLERYTDTLAENEATFIRLGMHILDQWDAQILEAHQSTSIIRTRGLDHFEQNRFWEEHANLCVPELEPLMRAILRHASVRSAWSRFVETNVEPGDSDPSDRDNVWAIRAAYREYRRRYQKQEKLLKDDSFIRSVAKAIGTLPTVKRLCMRDCDGVDYGKQQHVREALADRSESSPADLLEALNNLGNTVLEKMVHPQYWGYFDNQDYRKGYAPVHLLWELPIQVSRAGGHLKQLDISVSGDPNAAGDVPADESSWVWDDQQHTGLVSLAQGLVGFEFEGPPGFSDDKSGNFDLYLRTLVTTGSKLERLSLQFPTLGNIQRAPHLHIPHPEIPYIMTASMNTTRLKSVYLVACNLGEHDIEELLVRYSVSSSKRFAAYQVCLRSGTWAGVLDLMRAARIDNFALNFPWGAEIPQMDPTKYFEIFGGQDGKAAMYVNSVPCQEQNPMRNQPEGLEEEARSPETAQLTQTARVHDVLSGWMSHNQNLVDLIKVHIVNTSVLW